jgi:hypothetical protein
VVHEQCNRRPVRGREKRGEGHGHGPEFPLQSPLSVGRRGRKEQSQAHDHQGAHGSLPPDGHRRHYRRDFCLRKIRIFFRTGCFFSVRASGKGRSRVVSVVLRKMKKCLRRNSRSLIFGFAPCPGHPPRFRGGSPHHGGP